MNSIPPPGFPAPNEPIQRTSPKPPAARPDRNRLKLLLAGALAISAAFVAYTVFLGSDDGPTALNPIAQAAERTGSIPGSRLAITGGAEYPDLGARMTLQGSGLSNGKTGRMRFDMDMTFEGAPPGAVPDMSISAVGDTSTVYMSSPLFSGQLPAGKTWLKIETASGEIQDSSLSQVDPSQQLDSLRAVSDDFTTVGPERVRGVVTTHYQASMDYSRYADILREDGLDEAADQMEEAAELIGTVPVDVWIDDQQRIRRTDFRFTADSPAGPGTMQMSMEMFDYGIRPKIDFPPESQVYDGQALLESALG